MKAPETRERSAGGTVPALMVAAMMSSSMSPRPERNSATKRKPSTSQCGPPAAGTSTSGAGKEEAAGDERRADADPARDARGDERAAERADRGEAEHDPDRGRPHVQLAGHVEQEERKEDEVE